MRALTNGMLFLAAILAVIGLYVFRQQAFNGLQQKFGVVLRSERAHVGPHIQARPIEAPARSAHSRTSASRTAQDVQVTVTVIPVEPTSPTNNIQIGMLREKLRRDFWKPDVMTSSRDGGRLLETYIYLEDTSKATVVRLVNGAVVSVTATKTVGPPLLVPRADGAQTSVLLTPSAM